VVIDVDEDDAILGKQARTENELDEKENQTTEIPVHNNLQRIGLLLKDC